MTVEKLNMVGKFYPLRRILSSAEIFVKFGDF